MIANVWFKANNLDLCVYLNFRRFHSLYHLNFRYVQGQIVNGFREYFYFIDREGLLYLDDWKYKNFTTNFKDTKFLEYFFKGLKLNDDAGIRQYFPYSAHYGKERNYVRCSDRPIVYTSVFTKSNRCYLSYGHTNNSLYEEFHPQQLFINPKNFRLYHSAKSQYSGIGLIRSSLAVEFSKYMVWDSKINEHQFQHPSHFQWEGKSYQLNQELLEVMNSEDIWMKGCEANK